MIACSNTEPAEVGPSVEFPPVGSEEAPATAVPVTSLAPASMLAPSLWGKGDPPASITGKWPRLLGKTKTGLRLWHQVCDINTVEFQNTLQIARATKGAEHTLE